jgi:hypothetical protein
MFKVLYLTLFLCACTPKPTQQVNEQLPIIIDIGGSSFYIVPIKIDKGSQCYIGGASTDAPVFHCDFIREKE